VTDEKELSVNEPGTGSAEAPPVAQVPPAAEIPPASELPRREFVNDEPAKSSSGKGPLLLIWIVLILVLAAAGWFAGNQWRDQQQQVANIESTLQQQQRELADQRQAMELDLAQQLNRQQDAVQSTVSDLSQRLENINSRLAAMSSVSRDNWKLAEAEYLLRLANQRVLLERTSSNAVALAETVDDILRQLNDPELFPVRRAIAADISDLKLAGDVDREGVYLRLLALAGQIEKLPLVEPLGENDDPWLLDESADNVDSWWVKIRRAANDLLQRFSHHLRVRDHGSPVPAILPPDNQFYLKQNVRMALEQAQLSLLREEPQIYQASLDKAKDSIERYFPLNPQSLAVRAELADLQTVMVSASLPTFTESIALLREYSERRHALSTESRGGN